MTTSTTPRRLVLHMGMGKTGSSALQIAFVRNRDLLAKRGILYPLHASDKDALAGKVISGNGLGIIEQFRARERPNKAEFMDDLRRTIDEAEGDVLYSSELLYNIGSTGVEELRDLAASAGARLQAVIYVRDVAGHALSSYSQVVKRALFTGDFAAYLDPESGRYRPKMQARLRQLHASLGPENVTVLHYDSEREQLFEGFMEQVFGVTDMVEFVGSHGEVNRSLTRKEIEIMRRMNVRLAGRPQARRVSDVIIERQPFGPRQMKIARSELKLLRTRFEDQVQWVNETYFPDGRLSVQGSTPVAVASAVPSVSEGELFLLECLADLANAGRRKPQE